MYIKRFFIIENAEKLSLKELIELIKPIKDNVLQKKSNDEWDDYDEFKHTKDWLKNINKQQTKLIVFSYKHKNENVGIIFISEGYEVRNFLDGNNLDYDNNCVKLGPFHISHKFRGIGENWIKTEVIPYLLEQNIKTIFIESSHPKSFSLYSRLGKQVAKYIKKSDNNIFTREGKIFRIEIPFN